MSYSARNEAQLILRTLKGTGNFRGRSRRSELIYYQIAIALIGTVIGFLLVGIFGPGDRSLPMFALNLLASTPLFALFARRLHDLNLSGWWSLIFPASIALMIIRQYRFHAGISSIPDLPSPLVWIQLLLVFGLCAIILAPGTNGPNRYGPDPRDA